jgi:hypothetical protein
LQKERRMTLKILTSDLFQSYFETQDHLVKKTSADGKVSLYVDINEMFFIPSVLTKTLKDKIEEFSAIDSIRIMSLSRFGDREVHYMLYYLRFLKMDIEKMAQEGKIEIIQFKKGKQDGKRVYNIVNTQPFLYKTSNSEPIKMFNKTHTQFNEIMRLYLGDAYLSNEVLLSFYLHALYIVNHKNLLSKQAQMHKIYADIGSKENIKKRFSDYKQSDFFEILNEFRAVDKGLFLNEPSRFISKEIYDKDGNPQYISILSVLFTKHPDIMRFNKEVTELLVEHGFISIKKDGHVFISLKLLSLAYALEFSKRDMFLKYIEIGLGISCPKCGVNDAIRYNLNSQTAFCAVENCDFYFEIDYLKNFTFSPMDIVNLIKKRKKINYGGDINVSFDIQKPDDNYLCQESEN